MLHSLRIERSGSDVPPCEDGASDTVVQWIDLAVGLTRLPKREAERLRAELEDHARSRVADLLVAGMPEQESVRVALAELGDAARFAHRYRSQRNAPIRRRIMYTAIIGGVAASLGLSVAALTWQGESIGPDGLAGRAYVAPSRQPEAALDWNFRDTPLSDVFQRMAASADRPLHVHWGDLENIGLGEESTATVTIGEVPLRKGLEFLNTALELEGPESIDYRIGEGLFEVASGRFFDLRERVLVTYDIADALRPDVSIEDAVEAVQELVETNNWMANGGEIGRIRIVGSLIFVDAPPRMHDKVRWVFEQLTMREEGDPEPARTSVKVFPLRHVSASDVILVLGEALCDEGVRVQMDAATNSLLATGDEVGHSKVELLLHVLDQPPRAEGAIDIRADGDRVVVRMNDGGGEIVASSLRITGGNLDLKAEVHDVWGQPMETTAPGRIVRPGSGH